MRKALLFLMIAATLMTTSCNKDDDDASIAQPAAYELSIADELSADDGTQTVSLSKKTASVFPSVSIWCPAIDRNYPNMNCYFNVGTEYDIYISLSDIEWNKVGLGFSYTPGMGFKWKKIKESGSVRCYRISAETPGEVKMQVTTCMGEGRDAKVIYLVSLKHHFRNEYVLTIGNRSGCQISEGQFNELSRGRLPVSLSYGHSDRNIGYKINKVNIADYRDTPLGRVLSQMGYKKLIEIRGEAPSYSNFYGVYFTTEIQ